MESFQLAQVTERTTKKVHRTRAQARSDVFDHIECFYNPVRRHPTLGYLCPIQIENARDDHILELARHRRASADFLVTGRAGYRPAINVLATHPIKSGSSGSKLLDGCFG